MADSGQHVGSDGPRDVVHRARQPALPHSFDTFIVGRTNALAREASLALAQVEMDGIARRIQESYPDETKTVAVSPRAFSSG